MLHWVGVLCSFFYVFVFLCFGPCVAPNQAQLKLVVADWESHIRSMFFLWVLVGNCFLFSVFAPDRTVGCQFPCFVCYSVLSN